MRPASRTLLVPVLAGTDTIATLGLANNFSAVNTFSNSTPNTLGTINGALVVAAGGAGINGGLTVGFSLDVGGGNSIGAAFQGATVRDVNSKGLQLGYKTGGVSAGQTLAQVVWTDTVGVAGSLAMATKDIAGTVVSIHAGSGLAQVGKFDAVGLTLPITTGTTLTVSSTAANSVALAGGMTVAGVATFNGAPTVVNATQPEWFLNASGKQWSVRYRAGASQLSFTEIGVAEWFTITNGTGAVNFGGTLGCGSTTIAGTLRSNGATGGANGFGTADDTSINPLSWSPTAHTILGGVGNSGSLALVASVNQTANSTSLFSLTPNVAWRPLALRASTITININGAGTSSHTFSGNSYTNFCTDVAVSSSTGSIVVGNGVAATSIGLGGGNVNAGGTLIVGGKTTHNGSTAIHRVTFGDANYTALVSDTMIATSVAFTAPRTITFPTGATMGAGTIIAVCDEAGAVGAINTLTLSAQAGETIASTAGAALTLVKNTARSVVLLLCTGNATPAYIVLSNL